MANPNILNTTSIKAGNVGLALTNSPTTTLMTVDANKVVKLNSILACNKDGANNAVIYLYVAGLGTSNSDGVTLGVPATATCNIAVGITVPATTTLVILDTPIYLLEGDILTGGSDTNSDIDVFVSFEILDDA